MTSNTPCIMHPNFGYGPDVGLFAEPGHLSGDDRSLLRDLAARVAEAAALPEQSRKRDEWKRHNRLEPGRPMLLAHPEIAWLEMIPPDSLRIEDPFFRQWEFYLRQLQYRAKHLPDDYVIAATVEMPVQYERASPFSEADFDAMKSDPGELERMADRLDAEAPEPVSIPGERDRRRRDALQEVFGESLHVALPVIPPYQAEHASALIRARGVDRIMLDLFDCPDAIHRLMRAYTDWLLRHLKAFERDHAFTSNSENHVIAPNFGGMAYTDGLDSPGDEPRKLNHLWGAAEGQDLAEISPDMFEEFVYAYQQEVLSLYGLAYYGCCEPLTHRFDSVMKLDNLRKASVSAWCEVSAAAEALGDRAIFSWKPSALMLTGGPFDEQRVRKYFKEALVAARGCRVEITLNALMTLDGDPGRLERWIQIAKEEIGYYDY